MISQMILRWGGPSSTWVISGTNPVPFPLSFVVFLHRRPRPHHSARLPG